MNEETQALENMGTTVPTGIVVRGGHWSTYRTESERLTDLLAAEWFADRVHWLPTDDNGRTRGAMALARTSVRRARDIAHGWEDHADAITVALGESQFPFDYIGALTAIEQVTDARRAPYGLKVRGVYPSSAAVIAASVTPMSWNRWSASMEHDATSILHAASLAAARPDVWSKRHRGYVATPDRVAFRGVERFELPTPARYGANGAQPAETVSSNLRDGWNVTELLTTLRTAADGNTRRGWRGHRAISWTVSDRKSTADRTNRAARRSTRAKVGATNARGPAVGPWNMATSSLPRAVMARGCAPAVNALESTLRAAAVGESVALGAVTVTIVDAASVEMDGRSFGVREMARRAALASS